MKVSHRRSIIFSILSILFFFTASAFAATYEYDDLNRLQKYTVNGIQTVYAYDENGNRESKTVIGLALSATVQVNTITNEVAITVTAGSTTIDSVYIDWMDSSSTNNGTDILPGAGYVYNHTYCMAPRCEKIYKIRLKIRTKTPAGVYTYHYLTVDADVR